MTPMIVVRFRSGTRAGCLSSKLDEPGGVAASDIVPVPGAQFEETLASASPDLLRAMIREFAQKMMDADVESGGLIAVPIAWAVAYRLSIKASADHPWFATGYRGAAGSVGHLPPQAQFKLAPVGAGYRAVGSLGAVPGCQVWRALSARRQCSVTV
jgi:hypothetical protein